MNLFVERGNRLRQCENNIDTLIRLNRWICVAIVWVGFLAIAGVVLLGMMTK